MAAQASRVNVKRITVETEALFKARRTTNYWDRHTVGQRITAIVHTVFVKVLP